MGRCNFSTPLPPLKVQTTGQYNPSCWVEPCLLLQIGSANLLAGIIKKPREGGREGGRDSNKTSPISVCDNMKEGGTGKWRLPAVEYMAYLSLVAGTPKGCEDNHIRPCVLEEGRFVQVGNDLMEEEGGRKYDAD